MQSVYFRGSSLSLLVALAMLFVSPVIGQDKPDVADPPDIVVKPVTKKTNQNPHADPHAQLSEEDKAKVATEKEKAAAEAAKKESELITPVRSV